MTIEWINNWVPQICIGMFGLTAIFLVGLKGRAQRYGYVVGLIAQPFWYWETASKGQWLLLVLSIVYTFSWINGIRNHFLRKAPEKAPERPLEAKDALSEALDYLESDSGARGDLVGCAVPHRLYRMWHRISGKDKEDVCAE